MAEASEQKKDDFKYIVRLANTDIDGNKNIFIALQGVKGVGSRVAGVVTRRAGLSRTEKIGSLPDDKVEELEKLLQSFGEYAPHWAVNRQSDYETGEDMHQISTEIEISLKDDINRMKMIRCYKGIRHETGQKVRGQRTRSNGRTGLTMGVSRQRVQAGGQTPTAAAETKK